MDLVKVTGGWAVKRSAERCVFNGRARLVELHISVEQKEQIFKAMSSIIKRFDILHAKRIDSSNAARAAGSRVGGISQQKALRKTSIAMNGEHMGPHRH